MDNNRDERACRLAMNSIFGFDPKVGLALVEGLGSASELFRLGDEGLTQCLGPYSRFRERITPVALELAYRELDWLDSQGYSFITMMDEEYPPLLLECGDAPIGLYVRGNKDIASALESHPPVSIVGTRDLTSYGKEWCARMVEAMGSARVHPTVVSGFALGVDVTAHQAALDSGLQTIAVLPTGIDSIYPSRHRPLADRMDSLPGCSLITDYPPHTYPAAINFLRRNRIIAGMSGSTILVESRTSGGGMVTARLASSYGRDLFVLPGRIDDLRSQGCNMLLNEKIAEPVTELPLLMEALGLGSITRRRKADLLEEIDARYSGEMGKADLEALRQVALLIKKVRGLTVEEIAARLGLPYPECSRYVFTLESDGFVSVDMLQRCSIIFKIV